MTGSSAHKGGAGKREASQLRRLPFRQAASDSQTLAEPAVESFAASVAAGPFTAPDFALTAVPEKPFSSAQGQPTALAEQRLPAQRSAEPVAFVSTSEDGQAAPPTSRPVPHPPTHNISVSESTDSSGAMDRQAPSNHTPGPARNERAPAAAVIPHLAPGGTGLASDTRPLGQTRLFTKAEEEAQAGIDAAAAGSRADLAEPPTAPQERTSAGKILGGRSDPPTFRSAILRALLFNSIIAAGAVSLFGPPTLVSRLAVVVALSLPFVHLGLTSTLVRRIALRSMGRRRRDAAFLLIAVTTATAIITVPFVASDAFRSSLDDVVVQRLGPIDVAVVSSSLSSGDLVERTLTEQIAANPSGSTSLAPIIDGRLRLLLAPVTARLDTGDIVPEAQLIETDLALAERFGGVVDETGLSGSSAAVLSPGSAILAADLADALAAQVGSTVTVDLAGKPLALTVASIRPVRGLVGFGLDPLTTPGNIFVTPGTLSRPAQEGAIPGLRSVVILSAIGQGTNGETRASALVQRLEAALQARVSRLDSVGSAPSAAGAPGVQDATTGTVLAAKAELRTRAERETGRLRDLFAAVGALGMLAASLMVLNVVQFLAADRLAESGTLRAIGVSRQRIVAAWSLEGWIVALLGSPIGAVIGYALARLVVGDVSVLAAAGDLPGAVRFTAGVSSAATGMAVSFALALLSIVGGAIWSSRVALGDAMKGRDVAPPRSRIGKIVELAGAFGIVVLGAVLTLWAWKAASPIGLLIGPTILAVGVVLVVARRIPASVSSVTAGAALAAWAVVLPGMREDAFADAGPSAVTVAGTLLALSLTAVFAPLVQLIMRRRAKRRTKGTGASELASRLGAAESNAQPARAIAVIASFAVVAFLLSLVTLLHGSVQGRGGRLERAARGGYTFVAQTSLGRTLDVKELAKVPGVLAAPVGEGTVLVSAHTIGPFESWRLQSVGNAYVSGGPVSLTARLDGFTEDLPVWKELVGGGRNVIISEGLVAALSKHGNRLRPGDPLIVRDRSTDGSLTLKVIGVTAVSLGDDGILVGASTARALTGDRLPTSRAALALTAGTDPVGALAALRKTTAPQGIEVETFKSLLDRRLAEQAVFLRVLRSYVYLGLVVGTGGLAVVMTRAVRDRQRQLSLLRSLGMLPKTARRAVFVEAGVLAAVGLVVGLVAGTFAAWRLAGGKAFGAATEFSVQPIPLASVVVAVFLMAVISAAVPAWLASRAPVNGVIRGRG